MRLRAVGTEAQLVAKGKVSIEFAPFVQEMVELRWLVALDARVVGTATVSCRDIGQDPNKKLYTVLLEMVLFS